MREPASIKFATDTTVPRARHSDRPTGLTGSIMRLSGGRVRSEVTAQVILLLIGALAVLGSIYLLTDTDTGATETTIEITPGESVGIPQDAIRARTR